MRKNTALTVALGLIAGVCPAATTRAAEPSAPNILVIMADDLGYDDVGFQEQGKLREVTPNIDRLAEQGMRFTQGYACASVCGPSRAGFITGMNQQRFGFQENFPPDWTNPPHMDWQRGAWTEFGIPPEVKTVGDYLQSAGYLTGVIGKWHLGYDEQYYPTARGFDYFYGMRSGGRNYVSTPDYNTTDKIPDKWRSIEENGVIVPESEITYLTENLTEQAVAFIDRAAKEHQPFFLFMSYTAPHSPYQAKPEDLARIDALFPDISRKRATYLAMILNMDDGVGRILAELEKNRQTQNTLIVFLSDNGATSKGPGDNAPLTGHKWTPFEGGIRVPFVISWPGRIPAGTESDQVISALDLLPTFLGLAGVERPEGLDGVDLWPCLSDPNTSLGERALFWREQTSEGDALWGRVGDVKYIAASKWDEPRAYDLSGSATEDDATRLTELSGAESVKGAVEEWNEQLPPPAWPVYNWRTGKKFSVEAAGAQ
ncbi:sulfatase-like hydrolase/transferase [Ruficoccus amylovorans]|uniref:Sulfatase-like hydrolase/transferase n=1 Tax=Ruficoccus amylovorans TaxID=1804625 RepID=A0A842HHC3_9BACT|nr:sulfatase-like hydrolase/transferase [Ruficoccus amylovorans]MBC2594964.1 sulfatase-like hydrolase/transferase [Ruficoccus amylovorans]